ncbi:MAG: HAMP domain-containing histidine kinase [Clostridiales bacterium]|nr:HAMP domain-containing histidine kinase [Clostridiales bacterium]
MEIRMKEKTIAGLFLKYVIVLCMNAVFLFFILYLGISFMLALGLAFPANYAEEQLKEKTGEIQKIEKVTSSIIPEGCSFGVYDQEGNWLYGNFYPENRSEAWNSYKENNIYRVSGGYYRFIKRNQKEVCIIKYDLNMRYTYEKLNSMLPKPEILCMILYFFLFLVQAVFLAIHFSKGIKKRLEQMNEVTKKISTNNLDFQVAYSDLKEINGVLSSLEKMKSTLQESLKKQWDMEKQREQQLRALSHDIKTPLTIIRGNAELIAEESLSQDIESYNVSILKNVGEIETYLDSMRSILKHEDRSENREQVECSQFVGELKAQVQQIASVNHIPVIIQEQKLEGEILLIRKQIMRAWNNMVDNALEYTDKNQGIRVIFRECEKQNTQYLVAKIVDYGKGFSNAELKYATQEFYCGDISRHDRKHQGLGLAIAKRFIEEQGGFLEIRNSDETQGAEVSLWMRKI